MTTTHVRSELGGGASLASLRRLLGLGRPVGARRLLGLFNADIVLEEPLVTDAGVALGGHQKVTLSKDGTYAWTGHLRATGWPSYTAAVATRIVAADGFVLALSTHGETHGTAEPGEREFSWDQRGRNPLITGSWASLRSARIEHELQHDADFLGTIGDVVGFAVKAAFATVAVGYGGLLLALSTETISEADLQMISLPGLVGVVVAGGVVLLVGPFGAGLALVAGIGAGLVVEAAITTRNLDEREYPVVNGWFNDKLPPREHIVLTNLLGAGGRAFVWPGPGDTIWVNIGDGIEDPIGYRGKGGGELDEHGVPYKAPGQLLAHELTHAWQLHHSDLIPLWMCRGIENQLGTLGGDMSVYKYDVAHQPWSEYNAEQQASIMDGWFAGSITPNSLIVDGRTRSPQGIYPPRDTRLGTHPDANPYYRLVRDHLHAGVA